MKTEILVAAYSKIIGTRLITDGKFSGQDFREKLLEPCFKEKPWSRLWIDLEGTYGYPTSFLEEAFGGLIRTLKRDVRVLLEFKSKQEPDLIDEIKGYMQDALN